MRTKLFTDYRTLHLLAGCGAAALALGPLRKSKWRYPLFSLVTLEIINGLTQPDRRVSDEVVPVAAPEQVRTEVIGGIVMRWEEHGNLSVESVPVVMVHGLPTNPRVWRYIIPHLGKMGVRCLAWEQVGFGWSMEEGLGRDISIPKQAEYLYNWLQHLGISKAIFVGHDYGGGVIQRLLVHHPELAAGLILSDSVAYDNWPVIAVRTARLIPAAIENLPPAMVKPIFLAAVKNLGHSNPSIEEESIKLYWKPYNRPVGPKAFAHQLRHFSSQDTKETGAILEGLDLSIPSRVVWGDKDPLGLESAERLSRALNAPLTTIPGGRHFTIEDHPDVIASAIKEVMAEVTASERVLS